jgi:hypothetical protein
MGDIRNTYLKLHSNLKRLKPPRAMLRLPTERLLKGDPVPLLPILHFALLDYDPNIVRLVSSFRLAGKNDRNFVKECFLVANRVFGLRPKISPSQFLRRDGRFVELRLRFVSDMCDVVRRKRHGIMRDITGVSSFGKRNYVVPSITRCGDDATKPLLAPPPRSKVSGSERSYKDNKSTSQQQKPATQTTFRDCPKIESDVLSSFQSRFEEITASSCLNDEYTATTCPIPQPHKQRFKKKIPTSVQHAIMRNISNQLESFRMNMETSLNHIASRIDKVETSICPKPQQHIPRPTPKKTRPTLLPNTSRINKKTVQSIKKVEDKDPPRLTPKEIARNNANIPLDEFIQGVTDRFKASDRMLNT